MSDSQRPKPNAARFEVPDLELDPAPRSFSKVAPAPAARTSSVPPVRMPSAPPDTPGYSAPNLFDEDSFGSLGGSLELDLDDGPHQHEALFGGATIFEDLEGDSLGPSAKAKAAGGSAKQNAGSEPPDPIDGAHRGWPTGQSPDLARLAIDPVQAAILANYGEVPAAIQLAPWYAFRVFFRQRELKRELTSISTECERAELERDATLAELAQAVRPAVERVDRFREALRPLLELERMATERGQALLARSSERRQESAELDAALADTATHIASSEAQEQGAVHAHQACEARAQRAEAKRKRVHIEARAVKQVAEQQAGPGARISDGEAARLVELEQQAQAAEQELSAARAELDRAKQSLGQSRARLDAARQSERLTSRKKRAFDEQYQKEFAARQHGLTASEAEQRRALADLARAVLAARGAVAVPEPWIERVRSVNERADQLIVRRELQRRATLAYDATRVGQGVRLTLTVLALLVVLLGLKLVF